MISTDFYRDPYKYKKCNAKALRTSRPLLSVIIYRKIKKKML